MSTQTSHAPAWGWLQAWPPASPARPGRIPGPGSFPLPAETLQDWAPRAKMPCPGKRQEEQPAFPLWSGCVRAAAASPLRRIIGIHVQLCVLFCFTFFPRKTPSKPRKSVMFSTRGWRSTACLSYARKVADVWVVQGVACFLFLFLFFNSESLHLPAVNPSL